MSQKLDLKELAEKWPKRLEYTGLEKILIAISLLIVAGTVARLAMVYGSLPQEMPTHFDFEGKVDAYDSKVTLLILAAVDAGCWLLMVGSGHFTRLFNIPMGLLKRPLEDVLHGTRVYLYISTILMALLFLFVQEGIILVANCIWHTLPAIGIWGFLGLMCILTAAYFYWLWRG